MEVQRDGMERKYKKAQAEKEGKIIKWEKIIM